MAKLETSTVYGDLYVQNNLKVDGTLVGYDKVDNTSDLEKPISNAQQIALNNKVDISVLDDLLSNKVNNDQLDNYVSEEVFNNVVGNKANVDDLTNLATKEELSTAISQVETIKGDDGKSSYDLAVEDGFQGTLTEWLETLKGEKGDSGEEATMETLEYRLNNFPLVWDLGEF